jgi:hypothetical protein
MKGRLTSEAILMAFDGAEFKVKNKYEWVVKV